MPMPPMRTINFIIGNHAPCVLTEDLFEYIVQGIRGAGANINYSIDEYAGDCVNIIMEGSTVNTAKSFANLRQKYSQSRMYVIATDILTAGGLNSAHAVQRPLGRQYTAAEYWVERDAAFQALVARADGLIFPAETLSEGYQKYKLRSHYLPLVALPGYPVLRREARSERDIDVFFSGTLTDYRKEVLAQLSGRGLKVMALPLQFPDYIRRHFLGRSKLAVGLRIGPDTPFISKQRAHYLLANRMPHLFEATRERSDLHSFVEFAEPGETFLARCVDLINDTRVFPEHRFDDFRQFPPFDSVSVFRAFQQFLNP